MARAILAAVIAWPLLLSGAWWQHVHGEPRTWSVAVYFAASRVCHQLPLRSFHVSGVQSPVCGRCAGLYGGGAIVGVIGPYATRRRRRRADSDGVLTGARTVWRRLVLAALPTGLTIAAEWMGLPVTPTWRALAALPLGVALVVTIIDVLPASPAGPIR